MNEEELIAGCVKEKRDAQEALYKNYAAKMLGVCHLYAKDSLEAEDMLQEGFIKVFDHIKSFKGQGSFAGWIRRIMVNVALNKIRSTSKIIKFDEELPDDFSQDISQTSQLAYKDIVKAIQKLPEGYRLVFNLFVIEGYAHAEIASQLNITEGTSRSQLNKARKCLQQFIIQQEKVNL